MSTDQTANKLLTALQEAIGTATGTALVKPHLEPVGGGDINRAQRIEDARGRRYFVKLNDGSDRAKTLAMFEAEKTALQEIAATATIRVPQPWCAGAAEDDAYLVLEWLDFRPLDEHAAVQLGEQLAALHRTTSPTFGWQRDNTIGATPQSNTPSAGWVEFWQLRRLEPQLRLAALKGFIGRLQRLGENLLSDCPAFFGSYQPWPSLLHGDLWGGNAAALISGEPVVFDPASYFGDREADIAMTELFGGFPRDFRAAYRNAWPLDDGYAVRRDFYNLYHVLNHANLFGGGYANQAERMVEKLLAELR
jgi:protein-ribulosamine 3-kinase